MAEDKLREETAEQADVDNAEKVNQTKDSIQGDSARQDTAQKSSKTGAASTRPAPNRQADTARNQSVVATAHPVRPADDPDVDSAGVRAATGDLLKSFLKASGYKEADLTASNEATRTFTTSNGGKYVLSPKGTKVRVLAGPYTPRQVKEQTEGDDEE